MMRIWSEVLEEMKLPRIVTLVGGGGKTTLLHLLQEVCRAESWSAVATSTTKLSGAPAPWNGHCAIADEADLLAAALRSEADVLVAAGGLLPSGKANGLPVKWIERAAKKAPQCFFLVEGDGSAGLPLKGHLEHEPVVCPSSRLVVCVVGLDALGCPLDEKSAHRPQLVSALSGLRQSGVITPQALAALLLHPYGWLRACPKESQVLVYLNKTDRAAEESSELLADLLRQEGGRINGVISGSLRKRSFKREW